MEAEGSFEAVMEKFNEDGYWLGEEAIVIIAEIFKVGIKVINRNGLAYECGESQQNSNQLIIFYTGGAVLNHYDSVVNSNVENDIILIPKQKNELNTLQKRKRSSNSNEKDEKTNVTIRNVNKLPRKEVKDMEDEEITENKQTHEILKQDETEQTTELKDINNANNKYRKVVKIATWNVRGCRTENKRKEIDGTLDAYDIDIAVLQETNTLGVNIFTENYVWSVKDNQINKTRGLAVLIRKRSNIKLEHMKSTKAGIMWCKLQVEGSRLIVINVHAPNAKQTTFLSNLSKLISDKRYRSKAIILGDFNAQLGVKDLTEEDEKFLGKKLGHDYSNDNGELLKVFLHTEKFKNMSSKIGKDIEVTWKCKEKQSQIDHILTPQYTSYFIKFIKGHWTQVKSDHKLIQVGILMKNGKISDRKKKNQSKICLDLLKIPKVKKKFQESLLEISDKDVDSSSVDQRYVKLAKKLKTAAAKTLKIAQVPSTPNRKRAFNKLKIALRTSKKHPDMKNFKFNVGNRRQNLAQAIKEHQEKEIMLFFKNLNDFDVSIRIRKTYEY